MSAAILFVKYEKGWLVAGVRGCWARGDGYGWGMGVGGGSPWLVALVWGLVAGWPQRYGVGGVGLVLCASVSYGSTGAALPPMRGGWWDISTCRRHPSSTAGHAPVGWENPLRSPPSIRAAVAVACVSDARVVNSDTLLTGVPSLNGVSAQTGKVYRDQTLNFNVAV